VKQYRWEGFFEDSDYIEHLVKALQSSIYWSGLRFQSSGLWVHIPPSGWWRAAEQATASTGSGGRHWQMEEQSHMCC